MDNMCIPLPPRVQLAPDQKDAKWLSCMDPGLQVNCPIVFSSTYLKDSIEIQWRGRHASLRNTLVLGVKKWFDS